MFEGFDEIIKRPVKLKVSASFENWNDEKRVSKEQKEHGVPRVGSYCTETEGLEFGVQVARV